MFFLRFSIFFSRRSLFFNVFSGFCSDFFSISSGFSFFQENTEHRKKPINFAVESHCYNNVAALLNDPNVNVDPKYASLTPINYLAESISDANFNELFRCIKLLVIHCADLNIPNRRDITPMLNILKSRHLTDANKDAVATFMLDNACNIDLDTNREGEARKRLAERYPHRELPPVRLASDRRWDFNVLISALRNENEGEFVQGLNVIAEANEKTRAECLGELFTAIDSDETLLIAAIKRDLAAAVERMLRLGADINYAVQKQTPIEYACIFGHYHVLEVLLRSPKVRVNGASTPLASIVVKNIGERVTKKCDHERCFQQLLARADIDLNQADIYNSSPLHYAVKYNNREAILELMQRGAYIGARNYFDKLAICDISPKILEKHFDNCITTNGSRRGDDHFEIQFDYTNLVPMSTRHSHKADAGRSADRCADEMVPIEYIAESSELRHLVKHPLIASFLFLKWNRLAFVFYVNFVLCMLHTVSTVAFVLTCYTEQPDSAAMKHSLFFASSTLTVYIFVREAFQFVCSPYVYLKSLENYMEIVLIVFTVLVLKGDNFPDGTRRTIGATTILLLAVELYLLAGSLPFWSFSTHYVMLKTVTITFLKSFMLYAIILIAFALSFFTLLRGQRAASGEPAGDDDINKFENIGLSIMKTLVMSTGEFDAASIDFNSNTWSYIIFVVFLFLVATVLFNLLNGMAVSDTQVKKIWAVKTIIFARRKIFKMFFPRSKFSSRYSPLSFQAIKSDALLTNYVRRTQVMARYERILLGKEHSFL